MQNKDIVKKRDNSKNLHFKLENNFVTYEIS